MMNLKKIRHARFPMFKHIARKEQRIRRHLIDQFIQFFRNKIVVSAKAMNAVIVLQKNAVQLARFIFRAVYMHVRRLASIPFQINIEINSSVILISDIIKQPLNIPIVADFEHRLLLFLPEPVIQK